MRGVFWMGLVAALCGACSAASGDPYADGTTGNKNGGPGAGGGDEGDPVGTGGAGTGSANGGLAGAPTSTCGDGYCDLNIESSSTCPADCLFGLGGSSAGGSSAGGSSAGGSSAGGSNAGTGGGSAATGGSSGLDPLRQAAMDRAQAGVGFSYWWGHGAFRPEGPSGSNAGSCSGSCPSCSHSGTYGGDCSGFAAKVWQVPSSNTDMTKDSHPYSTLDFDSDTSQWSTVPLGTMQAADAMVYRSGSSGHIFIYDHGDQWGSMYAYECKGCAAGCTAGLRTASSAYHSIRRTGY